MRGLFVAGLLGCALASAASAAAPAFDIAVLDASAADPAPAEIASGLLAERFGAYDYREARRRAGPFWLRLTALEPSARSGSPALVIEKGRHLAVNVYVPDAGNAHGMRPLAFAAALPGFSGTQEAVYALPDPLAAADTLYVRVEAARQRGAEVLRFGTGRLDEVLARGAEHARMIALAFGALMAVAVAALLIWLVTFRAAWVVIEIDSNVPHAVIGNKRMA